MQFKYESNTTQATKFPILAQSNSVYEPLVFSGSNLVYPRSYKLFNAPERHFGSVNNFTDYGNYYWSTEMFNTSRVVTAWNSQGSATFYTSSYNNSMASTWARNYYAVIEGSKTSPRAGGICWPLKKATSAILASEGKTQDDLTIWANAIVSFNPTLIGSLDMEHRTYYIDGLSYNEAVQIGIPAEYADYRYRVRVKVNSGEIKAPRKSVCVGIKGGDDVDEPAAGSDVGFIYLSCSNSEKTCKLTMEPYGDIGRFLTQSNNYYTNRSHEIKYLGHKPSTPSNVMFGIHSYFPVSSLRRKWSNGSTTPKDVIAVTPPLYSVTTDYHAHTTATSSQFYYNVTGNITWSAIPYYQDPSATGNLNIPSNNPLIVGDADIYTNSECTTKYSRPHWYLEDCNWGVTW